MAATASVPAQESPLGTSRVGPRPALWKRPSRRFPSRLAPWPEAPAWVPCAALTAGTACASPPHSGPRPLAPSRRVCRRLDVETLFRRCLPMVFSLETSSSRYSSSVTIHRIGGTPIPHKACGRLLPWPGTPEGRWRLGHLFTFASPRSVLAGSTAKTPRD